MNQSSDQPKRDLDVAMPSEDTELETRANATNLFGSFSTSGGTKVALPGGDLLAKGTNGCPACQGYHAARSAGCTAYPWGK